LLFQGEFLTEGKPITETRRVANPREFAGYTFGYNRALFAQRVDDILTAAAYARTIGGTENKLIVIGLGGAGPWVAAAVAQARDAFRLALIDTGGFRFGKVLDLQDVNFLPGGAKYWDLPGILALCAPVKIWLAGEGERPPDLVQMIYRKAGVESQVAMHKGNSPQTKEAALAHLMRETRN
jgi:hypothetical protein